MFPVHIINPFVQQRRQGHCPGFAQLGSLNNRQHEFWPFVDNRCGNRQCTNPGFDQENSPIAILLQRLHEMHQTKFDKNGKSTEKNEQENCKESQSCKKQECSLAGSDNQRKMLKRVYPFHFQPIGLNDLMNARSTQCIPQAARESGKWHHKVDCRGFESRNIKVKIDTYELLIKAFKKEKSEDGVNTSCLRKKIILPKNIDTKKITCKLSPNGILLVEAPLLDKENKNKEGNLVTELMSMMMPGWKEFLEQHSDSDNAAFKKENEEKSEEKSKDQQGENENKNPITELMSMMMPGWKVFLEQHSDSASKKENEEKSEEKSKDQQGENENKNPITELMSMMLPGWKEFLEQHSDSDNAAFKKENEEKSEEKSKDQQGENENKNPITELMSMMMPGWKVFLEQHSDSASKKENEEKSEEKSKDQQGENNNMNPITELMSMMLPGWKEFREQHSDNIELEKENVDKSDEKSKDDLEKNEKEAIVAEELPVNRDDENSSTEQEGGSCNQDVVCEMEVSENDNVKENIGENNEQLVVAFENAKQDTKVHDDDGASNSSDDSFILLSQLEEESNVGDKDSSTNAATIENIEEEDERARESTNESDTVMESEDLTTNESHNAIDDSESESNKQWEFRLEMPSYNPESVKVSFDESKKLLEISATRDHSSGKPVSIVKSVHISDNVDVSGLKCSFRDGLLSVKAPYMKALRSIPISM